MELAVEVDRSYDNRPGKRNIASEPKRSISSLNESKVSKINAKSCIMKAFPTAKARVLGRLKGGKNIRVRDHNSSWYTLVYKGKKAFVGKNCF